MSEFKLITLKTVVGNYKFDWQSCFLCQRTTEEALQYPLNKPAFDPEKNSLRTLSLTLKDFETIDALPNHLKPLFERFNDSQSLYDELVRNKASIHKSCSSAYNKQKFERKKRKFDQLAEEKEQEKEEQKESQENDSKSRTLGARCTRRSLEMKTFSPTCFFCEEDESTGRLHNCQTLQLSEKVKSMAIELGESELIAKMSVGDMVATEAKYHKSCMNRIFNRYRSLQQKSESSDDGFIEGIALSELISNLEEQIMNSASSVPVFMLMDIKTDYQRILHHLGASNEHIDRVNVTRLKNHLLASIPGLIERKKGKFVILTKEPHGDAIYEASIMTDQSEGIAIWKASKIIRKHMFDSPTTFDGDLSFNRQKKSIPVHLLHLLGLILEGSKNYDTVTESTTRLALTLAQLVRFNAVKTKRSSANIRRSKDNEPPFPVQIGLSVHAKTREKSIIDFLSKEGLCIGYDRVLEIEDTITAQICKYYEDEKTVCPPSLESGEFTVAALDNIDHDPTSSTAQVSFHGTSISVFQYPETQQQQQPKKIDYRPDVVQDYTARLPSSYTEILPAKGSNAEVPTKEYKGDVIKLGNQDTEEMNAWIEKLSTFDFTDFSEKASFAGFFAKHQQPKLEITRSVLLPLLSESVNSAATVRHCIKIAQNITNLLNPGQIVVLTADQPVYAIGKQVQWSYQDCENVFWMMGPLHIEMAILSALGNWLEGSGWTDLLEKAEISTSGRIESFLTGKKVKRTRYAHLLSLAALSRLIHKAFKESSSLEFEVWKNTLVQENINANFWVQVIDLECLLFQFIKSLRSADFQLFRSSLKKIVPWMFALDHTHYARWLTVFYQDLLELHPSLLEAFTDGKFVVKKSHHQFSSMGVDQAHEQNNKLVKIKGGAIGILDNENSLLRWAVAGPILVDLCSDKKDTKERAHHEDTDAFERKFRKDTESLVAAFEGYGNPFMETIKESLVQISSKTVMNQDASSAVKNALKTGTEQFERFIEQRLYKKEASLHSVISKNKFTVFKDRNLLVSNSKVKIATLKADRKLFSRLYIACQSRRGDLDNFFSHENHSYPVSISEYGKLRKCNAKADFLKCLTDYGESDEGSPLVDMIVIDGAAFVNMNPPKVSQTFQEYCNRMTEKVSNMSVGIQRVDMCFDVYKKNSLKFQTREHRGVGIRTAVRQNTQVPKDFKSFMRNDENKTELFGMFAATLTTLQNGIKMIATFVEEVLTNDTSEDLSAISPCNHEEADTRLLLHAFDGALKGLKKIKIITVDTDVVVIALYHFFSLDINELWIEFGVGKNRRFLPIHRYAKQLGEELCRGIPFWYCLTGCDTVSMFAGRGKKTAWQVWSVFPEITGTFVGLPCSETLSFEEFQLIQRFVVLLYDRSSSCEEVNSCRRTLFTNKNRDMESIPPTKDALEQHVLRTMLQSFIWCNANKKMIQERDYEKWGWKLENQLFVPHWTSLPEAAKSCEELLKCGCKTRCQKRCSCKKSGMSCTELCKCGGDC